MIRANSYYLLALASKLL